MINIIQKDFDKVIKYSQGYPEEWVIDTTKILEQWYRAKARFIETFGGPIKEIGPFELKCSREWKTHTFYSFLQSLRYDYCLDIPPLKNFLDRNEIGFFENKVVEEFKVNDTIIPKGMKIVKALKYFIEDEELLASIQNYASELIQKSKISGILCFSVHPLDFLSSSENTHNWRSCHALDGEYRTGNLSYMLDNVTFMCYLKSDKGDFKLPNFPNDVLWNSKKWRMLMYATHNWNFITAGRQYPFNSENILQDILKLIPGIDICDYSTWQKVDREYDDDFTMYINAEQMRYQDFVRDCDNEDSLHFNDLLHSSTYLPYYTYKRTQAPGLNDELVVGSSVLCLTCGKEYISTSDSFFCDDCQETYNRGGCCTCCGSYTFNEVEVAFDEKQTTHIYICHHCLENGTIECPCCEKTVAIKDAYFWADGPVRSCKECAAVKAQSGSTFQGARWTNMYEGLRASMEEYVSSTLEITQEGPGITYDSGMMMLIPIDGLAIGDRDIIDLPF